MRNPSASRGLSLRHFEALLVTILVAGCSSSGKLTMLQAKDQEILPGKIVALSVEPDFSNPYPEVVATVSGKEITGEELVMRQVYSELRRRGDIPTYLSVVLLVDGGDDAEKPIEGLVNDRLLKLAVVRLGLLPPVSDGADATKTNHPRHTARTGAAAIRGV